MNELSLIDFYRKNEFFPVRQEIHDLHQTQTLLMKNEGDKISNCINKMNSECNILYIMCFIRSL